MKISFLAKQYLLIYRKMHAALSLLKKNPHACKRLLKTLQILIWKDSVQKPLICFTVCVSFHLQQWDARVRLNTLREIWACLPRASNHVSSAHSWSWQMRLISTSQLYINIPECSSEWNPFYDYWYEAGMLLSIPEHITFFSDHSMCLWDSFNPTSMLYLYLTLQVASLVSITWFRLRIHSCWLSVIQ